jgi:hypothetical protein
MRMIWTPSGRHCEKRSGEAIQRAEMDCFAKFILSVAAGGVEGLAMTWLLVLPLTHSL